MLVYEFYPKIVGGLGTYATEISREFVKMGHDVSVFTMNDDSGSLPTKEVWKGVEIHRPMHVDMSDAIFDMIVHDIRKWGRGLELFSKLLVYNILSAAKIVNELIAKDKYQYDIVVAHDWLSTTAGIILKRELKLPFVLHIHSTEKGRTFGDGSETVVAMERKGGRVADAVVTVSHAMKDELLRLGFPPEKIHVCYNGVDTEKYSPDQVSQERKLEVRMRYGIGEDDLMILFIGRLVPVKGVDKLISAMPLVLKELPDAKLVVVGLGDMYEELQRQVDSLGLREAVKFRTEFIPEEERIAHYAACDVAVFPSFYEPFGIVALEAMSMAKPVVVGASGTSGLKEIVITEGPGRCGAHVNPADPMDIARGVVELTRDPERRAEYGKNGRRRALEFTWEAAARRTLEVYEGLLRK